jgi:hypothetical protein
MHVLSFPDGRANVNATEAQRATANKFKSLILLVGSAGIEPATSSV